MLLVLLFFFRWATTVPVGEGPTSQLSGQAPRPSVGVTNSYFAPTEHTKEDNKSLVLRQRKAAEEQVLSATERPTIGAVLDQSEGEA